LALTGKWEEAAKAWNTAADRQERTSGKGATDRDELLITRYHATVARLAGGKRAEIRPQLEALLAQKGETRTAPEMEASAFLTWISGPTAGLERGEYRRSDERWAAFNWRREPEEGEGEVRGNYSISGTAWRAVLQEVQKKFPDCWPADYALARIYAAGGYTKEALDLLNRVTERRVDWWAPHYAVGQYYASRRDKDRGIPALRKALQFAPECRQARVYLSLLNSVKPEPEGEQQ
ncbi:MAG TPA: hypothetical protein VFU47_15415, partial [Armatimonadota bacterium]|nr:hypothetical protein [Armatimonadota bacterium]